MFHKRCMRAFLLGCSVVSGRAFVVHPAGHVIALPSSTTATTAAPVERPRCSSRRPPWVLAAGSCGNHNDGDLPSDAEWQERDDTVAAGDERTGTRRASAAAAAVVGVAATTAAAALLHPSLAGAADAVADTFGECCSK